MDFSNENLIFSTSYLTNEWVLLQAMLDVVINLQFHYIEKLWQTFWHSAPSPNDGASVTSVR